MIERVQPWSAVYSLAGALGKRSGEVTPDEP